MENVVNYAKDKKFTEFSNAVKNVMLDKLSNHEKIKSYSNEFDKIQKMKNLFAQINNINN